MNNRGFGALALILAALAAPAQAAEECLAGSIDQVGKCLKRHAFVQKTLARELHGIEARQPQAPAPFDTNLLATQLAGRLARGEALPLPGAPGEWLLHVRAAEINSEGLLGEAGDDALLALVWLRYRLADGDDTDQRPRIEVRAHLDIGELQGENAFMGAEASETLPACIDPEDNSGNSGYSRFDGAFRLLHLNGRRLLAASVSRSEGYAGGGGSFSGEMLFDVRDGRLVPIACYALANYQMFGGDWNPDGTRQHPEAFAAWRLRIRPGRPWPVLQLQPVTRHTAGATLRWDAARSYYVAVPQHGKGKK